MAICGKWIPGGVEVGVYASVVHHRKEMFGEDVDLFRPERWLGDEEKVRRMRNTLFSFSSGKYSCLGKYLSRLELLKVIPELIRTFEVSPGAEMYCRALTLAHLEICLTDKLPDPTCESRGRVEA